MARIRPPHRSGNRRTARARSAAAQPQALGTRRGQHVDDPFGEIEIRPARARLPLHLALRVDQRGHVRHMHPQPVAVEAQGIVRILVAFIVDGIGGQMGQVEPIFLRQTSAPADPDPASAPRSARDRDCAVPSQ